MQVKNRKLSILRGKLLGQLLPIILKQVCIFYYFIFIIFSCSYLNLAVTSRKQFDKTPISNSIMSTNLLDKIQGKSQSITFRYIFDDDVQNLQCMAWRSDQGQSGKHQLCLLRVRRNLSLPQNVDNLCVTFVCNNLFKFNTTKFTSNKFYPIPR